VASTSSTEKMKQLYLYGADEVILLPNDKTALDQLISAPVDVVLELVGAPTLLLAIRCLKFGGRLVVVGNVTASRVPVNPGYLIMKEVSIAGSRSATRKDLQDVFEMVTSNLLKPVIGAVLPLKDAEKAQKMLENKEVTGRVVLVPPDAAQDFDAKPRL